MIALIVALLVVQDPQPRGPDMVAAWTAGIRAAQTELEACYSREAVQLGGRNAESAETILLAVRPRCDGDRLALDHAWKNAPSWPAGPTERAIGEGVTRAEGLAVGALLEARAHEKAAR